MFDRFSSEMRAIEIARKEILFFAAGALRKTGLEEFQGIHLESSIQRGIDLAIKLSERSFFKDFMNRTRPRPNCVRCGGARGCNCEVEGKRYIRDRARLIYPFLRPGNRLKIDPVARILLSGEVERVQQDQRCSFSAACALVAEAHKVSPHTLRKYLRATPDPK